MKSWIVWTKGLARKLEVLLIAERTGWSRHEVAGRLMEFWEWVDEESHDGKLPGLTVRSLSAVCPQNVRIECGQKADERAQNVRNLSAECPSPSETFFGAMVEVGWLTLTDSGIEVPHFDYWMGKSAKRRLKEVQRKQEFRESQQPKPPEPESAKRPQKVRKMSASNADKLRPTLELELNTNTNACASADQKKEEKLPGERKEEKTEESENQTQPAQPAESAKPSGLSPQAIYDLVGSVADVVAGKKTGDAIRRGESSVLNPDVPPPPPVRPRGYHPSDYPEEFPKAKRIAKLYDREVGSEYGSASGIPEIIRRIVEGETVEALEQTVRNAGAHFKKLETPKAMRPGAKSFFSPGGRYDDYRDAHLEKEKPIPEWMVRKMKSDALEALEKKRREEEEACIAQCAAEGLCPPREHLKTLKTSWERMRMKADVYAPLILERLGEFKPQV